LKVIKEVLIRRSMACQLGVWLKSAFEEVNKFRHKAWGGIVRVTLYAVKIPPSYNLSVVEVLPTGFPVSPHEFIVQSNACFRIEYIGLEIGVSEHRVLQLKRREVLPMSERNGPFKDP
jgi:hypothetical protein